MVYVLDGPAIASVQLRPQSSAVFVGLTPLVASGRVCFCDEVIEELKRIARNEPALVWVQSASRTHRGATFNEVQWVAHDFPEIIDTSVRETQESAAQYVIAQAIALQDADDEVIVVSEDRGEKPTRASVEQACIHFGLSYMGLDEFLDELGIP